MHCTGWVRLAGLGCLASALLLSALAPLPLTFRLLSSGALALPPSLFDFLLTCRRPLCWGFRLVFFRATFVLNDHLSERSLLLLLLDLRCYGQHLRSFHSRSTLSCDLEDLGT